MNTESGRGRVEKKKKEKKRGGLSSINFSNMAMVML